MIAHAVEQSDNFGDGGRPQVSFDAQHKCHRAPVLEPSRDLHIGAHRWPDRPHNCRNEFLVHIHGQPPRFAGGQAHALHRFQRPRLRGGPCRTPLPTTSRSSSGLCRGPRPAEIAVLTDAYEATLKRLRLVDRSDPITDLIAKKIIEVGRRGVRDPEQISALASKELGAD